MLSLLYLRNLCQTQGPQKFFLCLLLFFQIIFPLTLSMTIFILYFCFIYDYAIILVPCVEKITLPPLKLFWYLYQNAIDCVCLVYFYTLQSVDLLVYLNTNITLSLFLQLLIRTEIRQCQPSKFVLFLQSCFGCSRLFAFPFKFQNHHVNFFKKSAGILIGFVTNLQINLREN